MDIRHDHHLHQTIYISFLIIQSSLSQEIPVSIYLLKPYNSKLFFYHPLLHTGTIVNGANNPINPIIANIAPVCFLDVTNI